MTPRSRAAWPRVWPRASSPTSIATAGRSARLRRRGERLARALLTGALLGASAACAYLNTFYNAEQAYQEGVRLRVAARDTLTPLAREAFERAVEKSAVVLDRHPGSSYADDALFLMGQALFQLGRHPDASAAFRRLLERFPESDLAPEARLGLIRSERRLGDFAAASAALGALGESTGDRLDPAELLYERALIELGLGEHRAAVASLRELLHEHREFARQHEVALRFAEAELAAGEHAAAIEAYAAYREEALDPAQRRRVTHDLARALAVAGRAPEAIAMYDDLLGQGATDSLAATVYAERGELQAAAGMRDAAVGDFRRAAELAPGTPAAARATLGRGRIEWRVDGRRETALETLLDAFLHAPISAWGDSARAEARALERVLHYERIVDGREVVAGLDDPDLVRATALYRLGEEVLEVEDDPARAAAIFGRIVREHPRTPWAPGALLAGGLLLRESGAPGEGDLLLGRLVAEHPDHPAADSARRVLGLPVPERRESFYRDPPVLASLTEALPDPKDPMILIVDQLDRYARARASTPEVAGPTQPTGQAATEPEPPAEPEVPVGRDLPPGVTP